MQTRSQTRSSSQNFSSSPPRPSHEPVAAAATTTTTFVSSSSLSPQSDRMLRSRKSEPRLKTEPETVTIPPAAPVVSRPSASASTSQSPNENNDSGVVTGPSTGDVVRRRGRPRKEASKIGDNTTGNFNSNINMKTNSISREQSQSSAAVASVNGHGGRTSLTSVQEDGALATRRVLRARPSCPILTPKDSSTSSASSSVPQKRDTAPKTSGASSNNKSPVKKVPTCQTCSSVLPPPPVDPNASSPPSRSRSSRKSHKEKEILEDCARCKRHLAIYGSPWPSRNPPKDGFPPTPREGTPIVTTDPWKLSKKALSKIDGKLSSHSHSNLRKTHHLEEKEDAHQVKRRKVDSTESEGRASSLSSSSASVSASRGGASVHHHQQQQSKRSGRTSVPSLKIRESDTGVRPLTSKSPSISPLSDQPRHSNGRFAVKTSTDGKFSRHKSLAATRRTSMPDLRVGGTGKEKRKASDEMDVDSHDLDSEVTPTKRPREGAMVVDQDGGVDDEEGLFDDDRRDKSFQPLSQVLPPRAIGLRRLGLSNSRPNPACLSRWRFTPYTSSRSSVDATPPLVDDDTESDSKSDASMSASRANSIPPGPSVPPSPSLETLPSKNGHPIYDTLEPILVPSDSDEGDEDDIRLSSKSLNGLGLRSKPTPVVLSKRFWAPDPLIVVGEEDEPLSLSSLRTLTRSPSRAKRIPGSPINHEDDRRPHQQLPSSPTLHRAESAIKLDDEGMSSGEEDVILPGVFPEPRRFQLQPDHRNSRQPGPDTAVMQISRVQDPKPIDSKVTSLNGKPCQRGHSFSSNCSKIPVEAKHLRSASTRSMEDSPISPSLRSSPFIAVGWDSISDASV